MTFEKQIEMKDQLLEEKDGELNDLQVQRDTAQVELANQEKKVEEIKTENVALERKRKESMSLASKKHESDHEDFDEVSGPSKMMKRKGGMVAGFSEGLPPKAQKYLASAPPEIQKKLEELSKQNDQLKDDKQKLAVALTVVDKDLQQAKSSHPPTPSRPSSRGSRPVSVSRKIVPASDVQILEDSLVNKSQPGESIIEKDPELKKLVEDVKADATVDVVKEAERMMAVRGTDDEGLKKEVLRVGKDNDQLAETIRILQGELRGVESAHQTAIEAKDKEIEWLLTKDGKEPSKKKGKKKGKKPKPEEKILA